MATIPDFNYACPFDGAPYRTHEFRNIAITQPEPVEGERAPDVPDVARTVYECGTVVRVIVGVDGQNQTTEQQSDVCDRNEKPFLRKRIKELEDDKGTEINAGTVGEAQIVRSERKP